MVLFDKSVLHKHFGNSSLHRFIVSSLLPYPVSRKRRTLVFVGPESSSGAGETTPLGRLKDIRETLANFNTNSDGTPFEGQPTQRLHGPGIIVELSLSVDPATQALCHINDDTIAWGVLERICRATKWRMMDPETGRVMGF